MRRTMHRLICCMVFAGLAGCAQVAGVGNVTGNNFDRAEDLGLVVGTPQGEEAVGGARQLPPSLDQLASRPMPSFNRQQRDHFAEAWMARSDFLCRRYKDRIIRASRDTRLSTDVVSTVLTGLATILTPANTVRALAGAATVVTGVGTAVETDAFNAQAGEVIASAMQTTRENQANEIEAKMLEFDVDQYNIYRAQRDVVDYHNMCSLETALQQIRISLRATAPDGGLTPPARQGRQQTGGVSPAITRALGPAGGIRVGSQPATSSNPQPPPGSRVGGAASPAERALVPSSVVKIQRALGVAPTGSFDAATRAAIGQYRAATESRVSPASGLDFAEAGLLQRLTPLPAAFRNAYERFRYGIEERPIARYENLDTDNIRTLQRQIGLPLEQRNGQLDPPTRELIQKKRSEAPPLSPGDFVDAELEKRLPEF